MILIRFLALVLILIISTPKLVSKIYPQSTLTPRALEITETKYITKIMPVLAQESQIPILSAQGVVVKDLVTNSILYEKNPNLPLLPASTTKIMTAIIALENYNINDVVTVNIPNILGKKMYLVNGEQITINNLIYGALVPSANDAAEVLARIHPKGRDYFIELMNQKANELGMNNTMFINPSGLESNGHVSTAEDMFILATYAMKNEKFTQYVSTKEVLIKSVDEKNSHYLKNINELLGNVDGVLGVKTGYTENARENLITYIQRDNHRIMIALLGSQDRFGETKELINWIFKDYEWKEVQLPEGVADSLSVPDSFSATPSGEGVGWSP